MMKHRDLILLTLPLSVLALVILSVGLLVAQFRAFEHAYLNDARETLSQRTRFIASVLAPDLDNGNLASVRRRIAYFSGLPLRVTVIDPRGEVCADSDAEAAKLPNHADRPEVLADDKDENFVTRYSVTMKTWLLYYATRLPNGWTVRASLPSDVVSGAISHVRVTVLLALLAGAILALGLFLYLFLRVRPHFNALQNAAVAIARGRLETRIDVPSSGPLRELAKAIDVMSRQLRNRIAELRRERNEFDTLFNTLREPLLLIAHTGEVIHSNRAASQLLGKAVRQKGFRIERTACPELVAYVRGAFDEPAVTSREIPFETLTDASPRTLLAHAVRMERDGALCLLLLLTDLTDLRRLESIRSDFVANVSHEIKTPLTAILSTVETLTEMPLDKQGRDKCLDILARQARRLNDLVQDILSLAAIERRQGAPRDFTPVQLNTIAENAIALCQDTADTAHITIRRDPAPLPALSVQGDPRLLEQAVVNLIVNAIRHSGTPEVTIGLAQTDSAIVLSVADKGNGIPPEHLPRLFERFYRVHQDRSRENGGTGLGLAIVKHIALLHGGSVSVKSTVGQGTIFTLTFPRKSEQ